MKRKFLVIGGGAAGFFAAINAAELQSELEVIILEGSNKLLQKVKVSGGGRCNVTHACFTPKELVEFYPRGKKELLGPFHTFMTGDTMGWFDDHGVALKIEDDNRIFPESDSSQTIIDCFLSVAKKAGVQIKLSTRVSEIIPKENGFIVTTNNGQFETDFVLVATGSNTKVWNMLEKLGHSIVEPVPSLFTFNIKDKRLNGIPGIAVPNGNVKVLGSKLEESGPVLITHWGLSGPGILKLSAWGALELEKKNYQFKIQLNWLGVHREDVLQKLDGIKKRNAQKKAVARSPFNEIPRRLWERLVIVAGISHTALWSHVNSKQMERLATELTEGEYEVDGKSTFKDEFVTAGGVNLKEVNFKRFESKKHKNIFFAGEVLNIDAITGGFNFQNAWTGGWIVANSVGN